MADDVEALKRELAEKEKLIEVQKLRHQLTEKQALLDHLSVNAGYGGGPGGGVIEPTIMLQPQMPTPQQMAQQQQMAAMQQMGMGTPPMDEEQAVLAQLISFLRSPVEDELQDALYTLSEMVSYAFDEDGARLGEMMRSQGGLAQLTFILADPSQPLEIVQQVLLLIGNLCSDSVDPASMLSKRYLLSTGVEQVLFRFLDESDVPTLIFTCGAVQNLCHDGEWSARALASGVDGQLTRLLTHVDQTVVKYAAGALKNISTTTQAQLDDHANEALEHRSRQVAVEQFSQARGLKVIKRWMQAIPSDVRLRRVLSARGIVERPPPRRPESTGRVGSLPLLLEDKTAEEAGFDYSPTGGASPAMASYSGTQLAQPPAMSPRGGMPQAPAASSSYRTEAPSAARGPASASTQPSAIPSHVMSGAGVGIGGSSPSARDLSPKQIQARADRAAELAQQDAMAAEVAARREAEESMERQMTAQRLEERRAQKRQEVKENAAATRVQAAQRGNDDTEEATNTHAMPEEPIVEAASMPVAEAPAADSGAGIGAVSLGAGLLGAGMLASSSGALFGAPAPEPAKPKKKPVLSLAARAALLASSAKPPPPKSMPGKTTTDGACRMPLKPSCQARICMQPLTSPLRPPTHPKQVRTAATRSRRRSKRSLRRRGGGSLRSRRRRSARMRYSVPYARRNSKRTRRSGCKRREKRRARSSRFLTRCS